MKNICLNYSINSIKKYYPNYSETQLEEIRYGLEGIYLSITKLVVISIVSIILNLFNEMLIMLICFNVLRMTGFGIHAKKSIDCWISSTIMFIGFPYISKLLTIPLPIHVVMSFVLFILILLYAPADTYKRPLIKKKKRIIYKIVTSINTIILLIISFFTNSVITNLILFGILTEVILVNPLTYKIFKLPYNNYKNYGLNRNV